MKSSIEELKVFITIVDTGSIVTAALQLQQTSSSISRALMRLEQKLAVTLIERTTRRLKLTQEGELFVQHARKILNDLAHAEELLLQSDTALSGQLKIDAPISFVLHVLAPMMADFRARYPHLHIELNSSDQIQDLLEHRTDVAIRIGELSDSSLHARLLMKSQLHLVATPEYLQANGTPQKSEDLMQHQQIGFSQHPHLNHWPILVQGKTFIAQGHLMASTGETVRNLVLQHQGIACLSDFLVGHDLKNGRLVTVLADACLPQFQTVQAVYYQQDYLAKRIRFFIDFLLQYLAQSEATNV